MSDTHLPYRAAVLRISSVRHEFRRVCFEGRDKPGHWCFSFIRSFETCPDTIRSCSAPPSNDPGSYLAQIPNEAGTVWINSTHPGAVKTPLQEQAKDAYGVPGKIGVALVRPFMKDPIKTGCRSALFAATSEDVLSENINAQYIVPDREVKSVTKQAEDEHLGEAL